MDKITGLLILFALSVCTISAGQNYEINSRQDSVLLEAYILEIKKSYLEEHSISLSNEQVDSLLWEQRISIVGAKLVYSPDGLFKIMIVEGEGCGAYCNPFWESKLILNGAQRSFSVMEFTSIDTIHRLPDHKYLIIQERYGRAASVFSVTTKSATLISFPDDTLIYHPIPYTHPKWGSNIDSYNRTGRFEFSQEHFIDCDLSLEYHPISQSLHYSYGTDFNYCCGIDSAYHYTGSFDYVDGVFLHQKENKTYLKTEW